MDNWFIRGPHGQIKWVVDEDGHISNYIGYGSNGNRNVTDGDWPPHIEPIFLDNDVLFPEFAQCKLAAGTAQDMTQQLGPLDTAGVSGLAGLGASANPDTAPGGNATFLQPALGQGLLPGAGLSDWIEKEQHPIPGFDPWKDVLGDTAPPQAPPAVQDAATDADFRLAGMWQEQEYYGAKPGAQQGSLWVDDQRNPRLPLPRRMPVGGWSPGSDWIERERNMAPDIRPPEWGGPTPRPRRGPAPLLPNADSGGSENSGTTEPRTSADDALQNAYNAQDPWGWVKNLLPESYKSQATIDEDPSSPSYMGHGISEVIPFHLGTKAYDYLNQKNNGALDNYFNNLSPSAYNNWANASIGGGMALNAAAAVAAVLGGGAYLGVGTGAEIVTSIGQGIWAIGNAVSGMIDSAVTGVAGLLGGAIGTFLGASARAVNQQANVTAFDEAIAAVEARLGSNPATADWICSPTKGFNGLWYRPSGVAQPNVRVMMDKYTRVQDAAGNFLDKSGNPVANKFAAEGHLDWGSFWPNWPFQQKKP